MMKANPDLYVQLQSKLPPGDVVEAIDIGVSLLDTVLPHL